jgi:hypothetical protein
LRPSWTLAGGAAWVLVATALQLARQRGVPAYDSIWAEDGYLYLTDALASGPLAPLLTPYSDYVQLVPRVIGGTISLLPLQAAAVAFSVIPALIVSLLSLYIFYASAAVLTSLWGRLVLAGLMVVLPEAGSEVMNNTVNLQWYLLFACIWPLLSPPRSRAGSIIGSVIVAATTLTIPLSAAYAPVGVSNLLRANSWRERYVPITFLAGAIVQLAAVAVAGIADPLPRDALMLAGLYGLRVAASLLVGEGWLLPLWEAFGWGLPVLSLVFVGSLFAAHLLLRRDRAVLVVVLASYSILLFVAPVWLRGTSLLAPGAGELLLLGSKWVVAPILLLATASIVSLDVLLRGQRRSVVGVVAGGASALLLAVGIANYAVQNPRSDGPRWSLGLSDGRKTCDRTGRSAVRVPVSPASSDIWVARIPCDRLVTR